MDRLGEFKKKAAAAPPPDPPPGGDHVTIAVGPSPEPKVSPEDEKLDMPSFFESVKEIEANIKKIQAYTEQIEKQHGTAVMSVNEDEKALCAQKLEGLVGGLTQASAKTRSVLRSLDSRNQELESVAAKGSGSYRMRVTKTRSMVDSFTQAMKKFKKMQEKYNEKYKAQLERQVKIVNPSISKDDMNQLLEDPESAQKMIFDIGRKQAAQKDLQQMKDRYEDVKKIAQSIVELQQMFMEMDEMVTAQGDIINRIEYSIDKVDDYTEEAAQDLTQAVESQKSIQKKKWLMMVLVAVLVLLLLAVLAYVMKNTGITNMLKSKKSKT